MLALVLDAVVMPLSWELPTELDASLSESTASGAMFPVSTVGPYRCLEDRLRRAECSLRRI